MSRISATNLLLQNQQLKDKVTELEADLEVMKLLDEANQLKIAELQNEYDEEVDRLERLCHANGI